MDCMAELLRGHGSGHPSGSNPTRCGQSWQAASENASFKPRSQRRKQYACWSGSASSPDAAQRNPGRTIPDSTAGAVSSGLRTAATSLCPQPFARTRGGNCATAAISQRGRGGEGRTLVDICHPPRTSILRALCWFCIWFRRIGGLHDAPQIERRERAERRPAFAEFG